MEWSLGVESWSGVLEWILEWYGVRFWVLSPFLNRIDSQRRSGVGSDFGGNQ